MNFIKRNIKIFVIIIIIFILSITIIIKYYLNNNKKNISNNIEKEIKITKTEDKKDEINNKDKIYVDIKGAIKKPGVYEMDSDKKVIDVVYQAGGLSDEADTTYVNLAKRLTDEMVIIIYTKDQIKKARDIELISTPSNGTCVCPKITNDACISNSKKNSTTQSNKNSTNKTDNSDSNETTNKDEIVNINTATLEQLQTISGIGESKAKAIIEYRETNGSFNSIEDIMNVTGIGESLYEKIKEHITV